MDAQDAEIREKLKGFKNKYLVMSGKGGVGKSTIAAYLAVGLAKRGHHVGLMDVDLHGPSIPRLLGLKGNIVSTLASRKGIPLSFLPNMQVMSIESLLADKDTATIWRGPLKIGVIKQFISDIDWHNADYLIIDCPPGTGDEPLTVAQVIPDTKAIIVTTPQEISLADVRKSIDFCHQVNMEILGLIENMSGLRCPHCEETIDLFKTDGGAVTAKRADLKLLGSLPVEPEIVLEGDNGSIAWMDREDLTYTRSFTKIVDEVASLAKK
ncbi:MAG: Mrp/NBP35 family ATP-binding protein [Deltaproteobacteria bacterium]|nr:MAG: Mrp/NBP35 family ATP-binding protein [Deltaproteobacteria bacterium]